MPCTCLPQWTALPCRLPLIRQSRLLQPLQRRPSQRSWWRALLAARCSLPPPPRAPYLATKCQRAPVNLPHLPYDACVSCLTVLGSLPTWPPQWMRQGRWTSRACSPRGPGQPQVATLCPSSAPAVCGCPRCSKVEGTPRTTLLQRPCLSLLRPWRRRRPRQSRRAPRRPKLQVGSPHTWTSSPLPRGSPQCQWPL